MGIDGLRNETDREEGTGITRVLARETAGCARDMAVAARYAIGASRLSAPYWMLRRFLGGRRPPAGRCRPGTHGVRHATSNGSRPCPEEPE